MQHNKFCHIQSLCKVLMRRSGIEHDTSKYLDETCDAFSLKHNKLPFDLLMCRGSHVHIRALIGEERCQQDYKMLRNEAEM